MIKQKRKSPTCGQCCLATILDISFEEAVELVGHEKSTKSRELTKHFNSSGNKRGMPDVNALCILRFKPHLTTFSVNLKKSVQFFFGSIVAIPKRTFLRPPNFFILKPPKEGEGMLQTAGPLPVGFK